MKRLLFAVMLLTIGASNVYAASDSHRKAAEELINVSGAKQSMDRMITQMVNMQLRQKPMMVPYKDVLLKFFNKYLGYDNIKYDFIDIYTEEFTEKELREITAFYNTTTGKKTIVKMPVLMSKGMQVGMSKVKLHVGELREMIQAEARKNAAVNKQPDQKK